jgi:hypothetical protein
MIKILITYLLLLLPLKYSVLGAEIYPISAFVEPDSGKEQIKVQDIQLDFKFTGYGYYLPSRYPIYDEIPLENGEMVKLSKIAEATFTPIRVQWKKYIPANERNKYDGVDNTGYRHWRAVEVDCCLKDWNGTTTRSRIKRPDYSDIFLVGQTNRGEFNLQIDQENGKVIHLVFEPQFIMLCSKDKSHLFPNSIYKYCPFCGNKLEKIQKP